MRSKLSMQTFRKIHYVSLVAYIGALAHGLYSGTDSPLLFAQILYDGTFLITAFLIAYWLIVLWMRKRDEEEKARLLARQRRRAGNKLPGRI